MRYQCHSTVVMVDGNMTRLQKRDISCYRIFLCLFDSTEALTEQFNSFVTKHATENPGDQTYILLLALCFKVIINIGSDVSLTFNQLKLIWYSQFIFPRSLLDALYRFNSLVISEEELESMLVVLSEMMSSLSALGSIIQINLTLRPSTMNRW